MEIDRHETSTVAANELTFGIELEFIAVFPQATHLNIWADIALQLKEKGIPVWLNPQAADEHPPKEGTIPLQDQKTPSGLPSYRSWEVTKDNVVVTQAENRKLKKFGWEYKPIELISRRFNFIRDNWCVEIETVLRCLREVEQQHGARFITNVNTGFHVHVGHGDERIPLRAAKNVFQLVTAFEKYIDELHAPHRIEVPTDFAQFHWHLPPCFFHQHRPSYCGPNDNVFHCLANIEACLTYHDLTDIFRFKTKFPMRQSLYGHASAYNFDNLILKEKRNEDAAAHVIGTIEFRQKDGTVDQLEIVMWVRLVVRIVEFCTDVTPEQLISLCLRCTEPDFGLEDFLQVIGCPDDVRDHYLNVSDSETVGFFSESHESTPSTEGTPPQISDLISMIEEFKEMSLDSSKVQQVIQAKQRERCYGIRRNRHIPLSAIDMKAQLEKVIHDNAKKGTDPQSEGGLSKAIEQVFRGHEYRYHNLL